MDGQDDDVWFARCMELRAIADDILSRAVVSWDEYKAIYANDEDGVSKQNYAHTMMQVHLADWRRFTRNELSVIRDRIVELST